MIYLFIFGISHHLFKRYEIMVYNVNTNNYSFWQHVYMKILDDKTLWVDDLPVPPIDYGPSRMTTRK